MSLFSRPGNDRRAQVRRALNARGIVVGPGLEAPCLIVDMSEAGLRIRLERNLALPEPLVVVDVATGTAHDVQLVRRDGVEAGLRRTGGTRLGGLTPSRLTRARDAWLRAGGR